MLFWFILYWVSGFLIGYIAVHVGSRAWKTWGGRPSASWKRSPHPGARLTPARRRPFTGQPSRALPTDATQPREI
jgi:hypothetical protein